MLEGTPHKRQQVADLFVFAVAPIGPYQAIGDRLGIVGIEPAGIGNIGEIAKERFEAVREARCVRIRKDQHADYR